MDGCRLALRLLCLPDGLAGPGISVCVFCRRAATLNNSYGKCKHHQHTELPHVAPSTSPMLQMLCAHWNLSIIARGDLP